MSPDGDRLRHLRRCEVDHRHSALGLAGDQSVAAVAGDRCAVGVVPDAEVTNVSCLDVHDCRAVGEVERREQGLSVRADRQVARPGLRRGPRRERLHRRRARRRGNRDHAIALGPSRLAVELEHRDHVALAAGDVAGNHLVCVGRVRESGDVSLGAVRGDGDPAAQARHPDPLHDLPGVGPRSKADDPDVVPAATGGERPQEAPVGRQRAPGREVAELGQLSDGVEQPARRLDPRPGADDVVPSGGPSEPDAGQGGRCHRHDPDRAPPHRDDSFTRRRVVHR